MKKLLIKLALLFAVALVIGCASKQNIVTNEAIITKEPQLLFLNYSISKQSNGKKHIRFINKIVTDGKLKHKANRNFQNGTIGDLECVELDENLNRIQSLHIKDPLVMIVEYVNDSNALEKKTIKLDSSQFSIKLQMHTNTKFILINEITETENEKLIITKLN